MGEPVEYWLVKIPTFVTKQFEGATPGEVLARLEVEAPASSAPPRMKLRVERRPQDASIPLEYNVNRRNNATPMMAFSETASGEARTYRMHGPITVTADVQPPMGQQYWHLVGQRSLANELRHRLPEEMDTLEPTGAAPAALEAARKQRKVEAAPARERVRTLDEIKDWLLSVLGSNSYSLDELVAMSQESKSAIKNALASVAQYDRISNKYTLKDEFRTAQDLRRMAGGEDGAGAPRVKREPMEF